MELYYLNRQHVPKSMVINSRNASVGACIVQISAQGIDEFDKDDSTPP